MPPDIFNQHGCMLRYRHNGVLLTGPPGSGKSRLALQLLQNGFQLVADDQVILQLQPDGRWLATCPPILAGKIHSRDAGLKTVDAAPPTVVTCIFRSNLPAFALSEPPALGVALFTLDFFRPDAAAQVTETLVNV